MSVLRFGGFEDSISRDMWICILMGESQAPECGEGSNCQCRFDWRLFLGAVLGQGMEWMGHNTDAQKWSCPALPSRGPWVPVHRALESQPLEEAGWAAS